MAANTDKSYSKLLKTRKRRNAKRKFFLFLRIMAIAVFFAGLLWIFNYFYNSDYFKIKSIEVTGNLKYQKEEIQKEAEIAVGTNIFEIDKKYIEDKLLDRFIWLKSVQLKKIFPDRISIGLLERKPFIKAVYGGSYYIMDNEGIVLDITDDGSSGTYGGLIAVKNGLSYKPETGEKIAKKGMLACGDIYASFDENIRKIIKEAYLTESFPEDIVFLTFDGKQIIYGSSDGLAVKNEILDLVLNKIEKENISYSAIDLRDTDNPLIK
jgi:cell division protein FtsQ